jgi:prophage antirepressor-like protein
MNGISLFDFDSHAVRVLDLDGKPWWVASDIANVLEYSQTTNMMRMLDEDQKGVHEVNPLGTKGTHETRTLGGRQRMGIITEGGLWTCVLRSQHPEAKAFARWLTDVLLPALREHGRFAFDGSHEEPVQPPRADPLDCHPAYRDPYRLRAVSAIISAGRKIYGDRALPLIWLDAGMPDYGSIIDAQDRDAQMLLHVMPDEQIARWLAECTERSEGSTQAAVLYNNYENWCDHRGLVPAKPRSFSQQLQARGIEQFKSSVSRYRGICLRQPQ